MAESDLEFRIFGLDSEKNEVPASVLCQALEGRQPLIWQFAFHEEGKTLKQRQKFSANMKERFALRLASSEKGSYLVKASVGSGKPEPDLFYPATCGRVVSDLTRFCRAAVEGMTNELNAILPDRAHHRGAELSHQDIQALIGRDILAWCLFTYDEQARTFCLAF